MAEPRNAETSAPGDPDGTPEGDEVGRLIAEDRAAEHRAPANSAAGSSKTAPGFEEFLAAFGSRGEQISEGGPTSDWRKVYEAGAASRQGEVDAARHFVQTYIDRVNDPNGPMPPVFPYAAFELLANALGIPLK